MQNKTLARRAGARSQRAGLASRRWAAAITLAIVALAAAVVVEGLQDRAILSQQARTTLKHLEEEVLHELSLQKEALALGRVTTENREEQEHTRHETAELLETLERAAPGGGEFSEIRRTLASLEETVDEEVRLIEAGRIEAALALDQRRADPLYERLEWLMERSDDRYGEDARRVAIMADIGTFAVVLLSALVVAAIFWLYERSRRRAQAELERSEERFELAVDGSNDGIWDWNVQTGEAYFSRRWKEMLGYAEDELENSYEEWRRRLHPEDVGRVEEVLQAYLDGRLPDYEIEHRLLHKDGGYRWVLTRGASVRDEGGVPYRMCGSNTDITKRKQLEEQLQRQATRDPLTGLPNRALFLDRLGHALSHDRREEKVAVLFLDLDNFKYINDSLGHGAGDELLVAVADRLRQNLRSGDTVSRLGGDEFAILLEDLAKGTDEAQATARRITRSFDAPFVLGGREVFVSASIGISSSGTIPDRAEDLMRNADAAMYRAKGGGRARHEVYDPSMHGWALERLELEHDLRGALDEGGELSLHYQPKVELATGRVVGMEALARWEHPERGPVPPARFIPVAEETGLIIPLGWWALAEACDRAAGWQATAADDPPLKVSVNLSVRQVEHPDLLDRVTEALHRSGLPPSSLELEITESVLMEDTKVAATTLRELKELGVEISVDDFGTGYSSLSYLRRFPVDYLKLDYLITDGLEQDPKNVAVAEAAITLAHALGARVVAEGVETEAQLDRLRAMGCDLAQGYLFWRPMPGEAVPGFLAATPGKAGQALG